jgi:hypothetical protein
MSQAVMSEKERVLLEALRAIAAWPDNGKRYGQQNIKRFAREQLTLAASLMEDDDEGDEA